MIRIAKVEVFYQLVLAHKSFLILPFDSLCFLASVGLLNLIKVTAPHLLYWSVISVLQAIYELWPCRIEADNNGEALLDIHSNFFLT